MNKVKWRTLKFKVREENWRFQEDVASAAGVMAEEGYDLVDTFAENGFGYLVFRKEIRLSAGGE